MARSAAKAVGGTKVEAAPGATPSPPGLASGEERLRDAARAHFNKIYAKPPITVGETLGAVALEEVLAFVQ